MDKFYCLKCGRLVDHEQALQLFRTGYFMIEHRLGCCTSCFSDSEKTLSPSAAGTVVSSGSMKE